MHLYLPAGEEVCIIRHLSCKHGGIAVVAVAQLVESRIVIPVVVGSSPISHPKEYAVKINGYPLRLVAIFLLWLFCFMQALRKPIELSSAVVTIHQKACNGN